MPDRDDHTPPGDDATSLDLPPPDRPSERIGPYKILGKIGEGGMGIVYLAEQESPLRRRIALKVIKPGMDSKQVLARFEAERQALALMDHPCIAKVFDAGETQRGLPYFVMEYVKGEPITRYCDRQKLGMRERLALFVQVCDGVQHAHQQGIIHRDLKPSNVLVTIQNELPIPRIIDFGVAKATAQRLTERTLYTELGALIGTPEYMSPEQAEMTGLNVDTRTDVYSLGVVLYELLTGVLPIGRSLRLDDFLKQIRETDPPRPSTRVSSAGPTSVDTAQNRRLKPAGLVSLLRGDLDWITMRALEKDRTRRYSSASDLAADLTRHLSDRPVFAGPPGAAYRIKKFVRRHKFGAAVTVLGGVALLAFTATLGALVVRIAQERNRANREAESWQQVSNFMMDLFKSSAPSEAQGKMITVQDLLDKGAEKIKGLNSEPEVQARLMLTIGATYSSLGLDHKAQPILEQTVAISRRVNGENNLVTLRAENGLALSYLRGGRLSDAEKLYFQTRARARQSLGADDPDTFVSSNGLAAVYQSEGRFSEAEQLYRATLDARRRTLGESHPDTLWSMNNLAFVLANRDRQNEALSLYQQAADETRRILGSDHPQTIWSRNNLGYSYVMQGQLVEAERILREVLDADRRVLGPDHNGTLQTMSNLGELFRRRGRYGSAAAVDAEVLEKRRRVLGSDHPDTLAAMNNLGFDYLAQERFREAERVLREALDGQRRVLGSDHPESLRTTCNLAYTYSRLGRSAEAGDLWSDIRERIRHTPGETRPEMLGFLGWVGIAYMDQARYRDAEELLIDALETSRHAFGSDDRTTLRLMRELGSVYGREHRYDDANNLLVDALERGRRTAGEDDRLTVDAMSTLAVVYAREGRFKEAEDLERGAFERQKRLARDDDPLTVIVMRNYANICALRGDRSLALDWLRRAIELGYPSAYGMEKDVDLNPIHGDQFDALVAQARRNSRM